MFWLYDLLGVLTSLGPDSAIFFHTPCLCSSELSHWSKWDYLELINTVWTDKETGSVLTGTVISKCSHFYIEL